LRIAPSGKGSIKTLDDIKIGGGGGASSIPRNKTK
jgi:hypothetical protein